MLLSSGDSSREGKLEENICGYCRPPSCSSDEPFVARASRSSATVSYGVAAGLCILSNSTFVKFEQQQALLSGNQLPIVPFLAPSDTESNLWCCQTQSVSSIT